MSEQSKAMAWGCKPSSGSSIKTTDGRKCAGWSSSVARARMRSDPSESVELSK